MRSPFAHTAAPAMHALLVALLLATSAAWSTPYVCPIDGERFGKRPDDSGLSGCIPPRSWLSDVPRWGSPHVTDRPVCPRSGFVMYREDFDRATLRKLRRYLASAEYQALRRTEAQAYLVVRTMQHLNEPAAQMIPELLEAALTPSPNAEPGRWRRYAEELVAGSAALADGPDAQAHDRYHYGYVALAWERRLGRFEAAQARLRQLHAIAELPEDRWMLDKQAGWIAQRDARAHWTPNAPEIHVVRGTARRDGITLPKAAL